MGKPWLAYGLPMTCPLVSEILRIGHYGEQVSSRADEIENLYIARVYVYRF